MTEKDSVCCPPFSPENWDDKIFEWKNKKFIRDRVQTFMFMPVNFGRVMRRLDRKVREAGAEIQDHLCLSNHTSRWSMEVYLAVDRNIPGVENTGISGKFLSKVYEGPFSDTGKWSEDFRSHTRKREMEIRKWYMWYTTCPKCAGKYGKNYVAIIAEVEDRA